MTKIVKLRKDGKGIKGTIANAEHHAQAILPFIHTMRKPLTQIGFALYERGHNVHVLTAEDGRKFTLRAFQRDGEYVGIRLALRLSRSKEVHLMDIDDLTEVPMLLATMKALAQGTKGDIGRSLIEAA